jgi:hypothetical protein
MRRVARNLHAQGQQAVGFLPADDDVGVCGLMIQLALLPAEIHGVMVNVLDVNFTAPLRSESPALASAVPDAFGMRTIWVAERVTLTTPALTTTKLVMRDVEGIIKRARSRFGLVYVDFTGIQLWGEQLHAYDLVDGVVAAAIANKTLERSITMSVRDVPLDRRLGVVLIG